MAFRGGRGRGKVPAKGASTVELPEGITLEYVESKLYPQREVKAFRPATESQRSRYVIGDRLQKKINESVWKIKRKTPKPVIFKYSDRYTSRDTKEPFKQAIKKIKIDPDFFPTELHSLFSKKSAIKVKMEDDVIDLDKIAKIAEEEGNPKASDKEDSDAEENSLADDSDIGDGDDYQIDYYDEDLDAIGNNSDNDLGDF